MGLVLVTLCISLASLALTAAPASAAHYVLTNAFAGAGTNALSAPTGVAVDNSGGPSTGDVYVTDTATFRVEKFDSAGNFLLMFGTNVNSGTGNPNICTNAGPPTDVCETGSSGSAAGQFTTPTFIAVDGSSGPSAGDIYVGDTGDDLVSKFDSAGNLVASWGTGGQLGGSPGPIAGIAVDSTGNLEVFNTNTQLFKFAQDGSFLGSFRTAGGTAADGLAVDPSGNFYKVNENPSVEKFAPGGADLGQVSDTHTTTGLATDPSTADLFVDNGTSVDRYHFNESGQVVQPGSFTCSPITSFFGCYPAETFGSGNLTGAKGIALSATSVVYAADTGAGDVAVFAPSTATAADYTWNGAARYYHIGEGLPNDPDFMNWSDPNNWLGVVAPSESVGTLSFPFLGFACSGTCYTSDNDMPGINVNAMHITGGGYGAIYKFGGKQIALGEGGITVTPAIQATASTETDITAPILLSAPQTWTINGSPNGRGSLHIEGKVSGQPLNVAFNLGNLRDVADIETAAVSFSGAGSVTLGGFEGGQYLVGALNGYNGNPVNLGAGVSMFDENTTQFGFDKNPYDLGALTLAGNTLLEVGEPEYSAPVSLPVNGGITFSPTSQLALRFNSQITATGPVNLGGAKLSIRDGTTLINGAPACNVLDVDTLIATTGTLTGTFGGIPDGAVIPVPCGLPVDAVARINYTAHSVIATLIQRTSTALEVSNTTPPARGNVTATATVTGERMGDGIASGTVQFFDGGAPIAGCAAQPVSPHELVAVASCDLSFQAAGTHEITAAYAGSPTFLPSTSSTPRVIIVQPAGPGSHQGAGHGVSLLSKTIRVSSSGTASVRLDCRGQASCHGMLALTIERNKGTTTIGTARFSIATGGHRIEVKLSATGKRLLARAGGRLEATLLIGGSGGGGRRRVDLFLIGPRAGH